MLFYYCNLLTCSSQSPHKIKARLERNNTSRMTVQGNNCDKAPIINVRESKRKDAFVTNHFP